MKYKQFKKIKNIDLKLLMLIGAVTNKIALIKIDTYPDFNKFVYNKHSINTCTFEYEWSYRRIFNRILSCNILEKRVFHSDDISTLKNKFSMDLNVNGYIIRNETVGTSKILSTIRDLGFSTQFDGFKLHQIKLSSIENTSKELVFSGAYDALSSSIDPVDWGLYIACAITATSFMQDFYEELIIEAFNLKNNGDNKLSFFILFSALESFINETMNTHNTQERLKDILRDMYKSVNSSEVYTSIIGEFSEYEIIRNTIAHGRDDIEVDDELLFDFSLFTLTLIALHKKNEITFQTLVDACQKL